MRFRTVCLSAIFALTALLAQAQGISQQYLDYIERYKEMAVDQMVRYKIPASITLAQGLLESGAGTSTLARKANNHFGIKCGKAWKGPYVLQDDDARNERFRKYRSVEESYEDHSRFLQQARYSSLFKLSMKDYKGWAKGLKRCGYAMGRYDAYVNIAGGLKMNEPALDLALIMALASSFKNRAADPGMMIFGEVGLAGEVRAVSQAAQRVAEAVKMGFSSCMLPKANLEKLKEEKRIRLIGVSNVREAIGYLNT